VNVSTSAFVGNRAAEIGGAIALPRQSKLSVSRSRLVGNRAPQGAAIGSADWYGGTLDLHTCLLVDNVATADDGALVISKGHAGGSEVFATFLTVAGNDTPGGAFYAENTQEGRNGKLEVENCIVVGTGQFAAFADAGRFANNLVHGFAKVGHGALEVADAIQEAPMFRNPDEGDYGLLPHSPAVNRAVAGEEGQRPDIEGNSRPYNGNDPGIDLGCGEAAPVPVDAVILLQ
jgi:hypothetical protein